jgi:hypothetical protein
MGPKKFVQQFYKSDALIDAEVMAAYIHPDIRVEWQSSKGLIVLDREKLLSLTTELGRAYMRSKARISFLLQEGNFITVRYDHYIKTIENPREEMLLAHFMVIWELKDDKLYRGYQISQIS